MHYPVKRALPSGERSLALRPMHAWSQYLGGLMLWGIAMLTLFSQRQPIAPLYFAGVLLLSSALTALLWGMRPALLIIVFSMFSLDYVYLPLIKTTEKYDWSMIALLFTFAISAIALAFLTTTQQRKVRKQTPEHVPTLPSGILAALFDAVPDCILIYDCTGRLVQASSSARLRLPDMRVIQVEEQRWPLRKILNGETISQEQAVEISVPTSERHILRFHICGSPIRNHTQQVVGAVLVAYDMCETAQRQAEEILPTLLEMTELLLRLPQKSLDEKEAQAGNDNGLVEQQLLTLTCRLLECSTATVVAVDPLTEQLSLIAYANQFPKAGCQFQLDNYYLQDYLSQEQIQLLHAGQVIHHAFLQEKEPYTYRFNTLVAPIQLSEQLRGLFVLTYPKERDQILQTHGKQIKALTQTLALILEREQRLHEHIETQAGELVLRHALRRMDESISLVSHELKSPLTAIHVNTQLAQHRVKRLNSQQQMEAAQPEYQHTIAAVQGLLESIENQVRIQNRLIDDLLDVPRLQTDCLRLDLKAFNLVELVREIAEEQRQVATERTIACFLPQNAVLAVVADRDRIRQVLNNYLTNAMKYSPEPQPIVISLEVQGGSARIAVSDRGPGLSESEQTRIWQRFYQAPGIKLQTGSNKGLGLGLHICRTIIEQHHGQIGVNSTPGYGSTFWFTLPIAC